MIATTALIKTLERDGWSFRSWRRAWMLPALFVALSSLPVADGVTGWLLAKLVAP